MAAVQRWTGAEAKALRQALRLSVRAFAEHLDVDRRTVNKWEARGSTITPLPDKQGLLDSALHLAGEEVKSRFAYALATSTGNQSAPEAQLPSTAVYADASGGVLLPVTINGQVVLVPIAGDRFAAGLANVITSDGDGMSPLDRRSVLMRGIALAALAPLGLDDVQQAAAALEDARRNFDGSVVDYFRRQLDICMADDGRRGPKETLPMVLGILEAVSANVREVKPTVRRDVLSFGARCAEFAGWLYRDMARPEVGGFWYDRATEWAQEAGDLPMQGYVLLKKSQMAYDERDAVRVLTLAQAAQEGPWQLPTTVKAEVTQQEARGLAMVGEPLRLVEQKLDDARRLLADGDAGSQPGQLSVYFNDGTLTLRTASCYIEAGKPHHAATLYRQVLSADQLSRRDRGYFMARLASSLALAGEPDDSAAVGLESIALAAVTSSERTKRELGRALRTLQPWKSRPGPRQLREAMSASSMVTPPP